MFQVCFKCRLPGHKVEECLMNDSDQGTGVCYKCGSQEHTSSTCKAKLPPGTFSTQQSFPFSVLTCYLGTVIGFCSHWLMQFQWMVMCYDMPPLQLMHCCTLQIREQKITKVPGWVGDVLFWSHRKDSFHQQWCFCFRPDAVCELLCLWKTGAHIQGLSWQSQRLVSIWWEQTVFFHWKLIILPCLCLLFRGGYVYLNTKSYGSVKWSVLWC